MMVYGFLVLYFLGWIFDEGVYYFFIIFFIIGFGDYVLYIKFGIKSFERLFLKNFLRQEGSKFRVVYLEDIIYLVIYNVLVLLYCMFGLCVVFGVINFIMIVLEEMKNFFIWCVIGCIF